MTSNPMGLSSYSCGKNVVATDMTTWLMQHKIRKTMEEDRSDYPLGGEGRSAMVDGVHFGKIDATQMVFIVEVENKTEIVHRAYAERIEEEKASEVAPILKKVLKSETLLVTDGHTAYPKTLKKLDDINPDQFDLCNISHAEEQRSHNHLFPLNRVVGNFKSWMHCIYKHCRPRNMNLFLNEFCYRFNRRRQAEGNCFWNLLDRSISRPKFIFYSELVEKRKKKPPDGNSNEEGQSLEDLLWRSLKAA